MEHTTNSLKSNKVEIMEKRILEHVEFLGAATFLQLCFFVDGFYGDREFVIGDEIIVWEYCSKEAIAAIISLIKKKKAYFLACDPISYDNSNYISRYPLYKPDMLECKTPHWLPSGITTIEYAAKLGYGFPD